MPARHETSAQRWRELHGAQPGRQREESARRAADPLQLEADRLRKTQRWVRLRAWFLRGHPLCARCASAGRTEAARDVDHVVPMRALLAAGDVERVFDPANLQALCGPCHATKSAAERAARHAPVVRGAAPGGGRALEAPADE